MRICDEGHKAVVYDERAGYGQREFECPVCEALAALAAILSDLSKMQETLKELQRIDHGGTT